MKETTRWKAVATIYFATPTTEKDLLKNPLGVFIKEYSWNKNN